MKRFLPILAGLAFGAATANSFAADWDYRVTPYLWASSLDGTQGIAGRSVELDAGFSDLVEFLDIGFAARVEGQAENWGWFADAFYVQLSDEKNLPVGSIGGQIKQKIAELGVTYSLSPGLEALVGARYQESRAKLDFPAALPTLRTDEDWTDGFVGLRWTPVDGDKWRLWLRGDVGAGDSDQVWFGEVGLSYRFNETYSLVGGYRHLDTEYENGGFTWDMTQSGLGVGLTITW